MVRINLFAILSFILLTISCQQTRDSSDISSSVASSEFEKELSEVVMKIWKDAVNKDTTSLKAIHLNSLKFSKFGPRISIRQDVESTNETETEHFSSITDGIFEIEDLKVDVFGEVAVTTFYNSYSFIKNNIRVKGKGRVTLVFLRTEEGWKIIHEHSSPFNE